MISHGHAHKLHAGKNNTYMHTGAHANMDAPTLVPNTTAASDTATAACAATDCCCWLLCTQHTRADEDEMQMGVGQQINAQARQSV